MVMGAPSSPIARSDSAQAAALEEAFAARRAWAFEAAYDLYRRLLYGAALAVLRDPAEAEDCVHDTLMRLWQRGHSYSRERGVLAAFLTVCVRNDALSRARKRSNRSRIEAAKLRDAQEEPASDEAFAQRERMTAAMRVLSEVQHETVRLAYYEGLTHEEIARRMNEPLGTVKSRLATALRTLRLHFRNAGEES
jgi:RNA polymerase sigma-70 factor (ECF subfamily)